MTRTTDAGIGDGVIVVVAPHMDDESLGCGLLLATHPEKSRVHVVFVTDGSRSPEPPGGLRESESALAELRTAEAHEALATLGIPAGNVHFLGFEDGTLGEQYARLRPVLTEFVRRLQAQQVFVPFRYDRHPDHIAINRAVCAALREGEIQAKVFEYFVYSQWRLLPAGDVRAYLSPGAVHSLGPGPEWAAQIKRRALECHRTQTTRYFGWQARPVLTSELLDRVCGEAETYLSYDPAQPGRAVFSRGATWVALAHHIEPRLKRWKDRLTGGGVA